MERSGLCSSLYLCCSLCDNTHKFSTSRIESDKAAEVNKLATLAADESGLGREGLADITSILNIPPPVSDSNFSNHLSKLLGVSRSVCNEQMKNAAQQLRNSLNSELEVNNDKVFDVAVSYDGTWSKRGFTANHGVGVVISVDTGEVLDIEVLSKVCEICKQNKAKRDESAFEEWRTNHKAEGSCQANYEGSSPNMETEAAYRLWGRSIQQHNLRYKWMISDGDSKAYQKVSEIYGVSEADKVEKLDCIGHVGKRMYRALNGIKTTTKGKLLDGKPVGGRKGRLTEPVVRRLSELYRNAIRQNVDPEAKTEEQKQAGIENLQKNIIAVLYHSVKIQDAEQRHQYCPEESWCKYKKVGENEEKDYHLDPPFLELLEPTFDRLSEDRLMERCLPGFSQNQNESFNSLIWKRAPKHTWQGPKRVELAAYLAVLHFNNGDYAAKTAILSHMELNSSKWLSDSANRKDQKRLYGARRDTEDSVKRKRKSLVLEKQASEERKIEKEGITYKSGLF